jgi:hypothetical protein
MRYRNFSLELYQIKDEFGLPQSERTAAAGTAAGPAATLTRPPSYVSNVSGAYPRDQKV